jgi:ATPase MipZ
MRDWWLFGGLNLSDIAARQEVRDLIKALNLPDVIVKF